MKHLNSIKFRNRSIIYLRNAFAAVLLLILIAGCSQEDKIIKIALSKGSGGEHYENYSKWIKSFDQEIEIIDMHQMSREEAFEKIKKCSGLVLTGGPDVDPNKYGRPGETGRCDIDYERDTLEFGLIDRAIEQKIPLLGICRGEQILNVAMGGSLVVDIPTDFDTTITHQCMKSDSCYHEVTLVEGSYLSKITGITKGRVNSNHHQAVEGLAVGFDISAYSDDGLIEAYEWSNHEKEPFMISVQWHPERLDKDNPLSHNIGKEFITAVKEFHKKEAAK